MLVRMNINETIAGSYQVIDLISTGGQATVAKAIEKKTGRYVAIRMLTVPDDAAHREQEEKRFRRAARLRFGHPNIVDPTELVEENGNLYMIMPFIDGLTLQDLVARSSGLIPVTDAIEIIHQVGCALGACHARGVTHRDIKPDNILIDNQGQVYVLDLGICSVAGEPTFTRGDKFQGSFYWTSPEQIASPGASDPRLDLYSLGAVFFLLLTGCYPACGDTQEQILSCVCNQTPPPPRSANPSIPWHIDRACMRLLAKDPARRFQTAGEFLRCLAGDGIPALESKYCVSCGESANKESSFCTRCGASLQGGQNSSDRCIACGAAADNCDVCPSCGRQFSPSDHRLVFAAGSLTGAAFRIPEGNYVIGRATLSPRDFQISRQHVHVSCLNGSVQFHDAGSANKTRVGGELVDQPVELQPGMEVAIAGNIGKYNTLDES